MRLKFLVPFGIFILLSIFLFKGLYMDPRQLPSALINKPMPVWQLPELFDDQKTFSPEQMKGRVWLLNVWATWCQPCKQEHPVLVALKRQGVKTPFVGLVYRDGRAAADAWLRQEGNPYDIVVFEPKSSATIDMGVTGVPETFVVDKKGMIRLRISGAITPERWEKELRPLLDDLDRESPDAAKATEEVKK